MPYENITDFESLYKGLQKSKKGTLWKDSVAVYAANGLKNTYKLKTVLEDGTYQLEPYHKFTVTDPKRREVLATNIRDRHFQRTLCDEGLYEDLTEHFIYDNAACQKGKGVDFALDRMQYHLKAYYNKYGPKGYVLKCDIKHFFAETQHSVAKAEIRKYIRDETAYFEVCKIIDSFGGEKGIGLGSQVSQLVQLAVLNGVDHYIKERLGIKHYLRYMDDFILIHNDKQYLIKCKEEIEVKLRDLSLELNEKTQLFPIKQGIPWLKTRFILTETGKVIRYPNKNAIKRERRKLKKLKAAIDSGRFEISVAIDSFMSCAAAIERRQSKKNTARRKAGMKVPINPCSLAVENLRVFFRRLFGFDPYTNTIPMTDKASG